VSRPLEVTDISVDYGGVRAVDDVTIHVDDGETLGLIGPNGAGKTTLFDAILGLVSPSAGSIRIFGEHVSGSGVKSWSAHRRARLGVGRTFQRLELFGSLTVLENLVVSIESGEGVGGLASELLRRPASIDARRRAHDRAAELCETVGLTAQLKTRAGSLPIGHARLLELARALARRPRLLLLDEPSSGLNAEETDQLASRLRTIRERERLSLLVVEHDMDFVLPLSDRIDVLDFGRRIATGTPSDIQRDPVVRAAYLGEEVPDAGAS
jgi:branched-chain amino acid transport system ATP-binding protein